MSQFSYEELRNLIPEMNSKLDGDFRIEVLDIPGPVAIFSYAAPAHFSILTLGHPSSLGGMTRIDIIGGGARGVLASPAAFEQLVTKATSALQWGGPFASIFKDGTTTFGIRTAISSGLLSPGGGGFAFMAGMIRVMGESARLLAQDIVAHDGGHMFTGVGDDTEHLLTASRVGALIMR